MNAEETKQAAAVMAAYDSKKGNLQFKLRKITQWLLCSEPVWDWATFDYRIAPEPEPSMLVGPFTQIEAGTVSVTFANPHAAIEKLCLKVFGAKPTYESSKPAPEPMEVEVWVDEKGRVADSSMIPQNRPQDYGWTLRRATIHPTTK